MSRLRQYLPATLRLPARSWAVALLIGQVGGRHLLLFPRHTHLECGQVQSGCQVLSSGSAAELVTLGGLGVSVMPALTLFTLPPCKVSQPSGLPCNARAS